MKSPEGRWKNLPLYRGYCNRYLVQVPRERIGYVNAILESHEGLARIRTVEIGTGILEIVVPGEWDDLFQNAAAALSRECLFVFRGCERGMPPVRWGAVDAPEKRESRAIPAADECGIVETLSEKEKENTK